MLDRSKSYAEVYGHAWAKFEQGGTLYDGAGKSYDEQGDRAEVAEELGYVDKRANLENAREFLQRILKEGPMSRENVVKEAENQGYKWENVKNAAVEIKVSSNKIRGTVYWRLALE